MNRFLANERTRAGLLIVAAALIGGTGCVTAMVVGNVAKEAQYKQQRQKWEEKQQAENAAARAGAARGEAEAMTRLGWHQVSGDRFGVPADPRGITLLEQAAARQYVPAEYLLGLVLVEGRKGITPDPVRGLQLLKRSATKTCAVNVWQEGAGYHYPARTLGYLYHEGKAGVSTDDSEAELWMARNAAYCRDFSYNAYFPAAGLSKEQRAARLEAWWRLSRHSNDPYNTTLSAEQLQETERELQRLRQRVRDSETQYSAPQQRRP